MILTEEQVSPLVSLYEQGLYLQSHEAGLQYGLLKDWSGSRGRMIAARLAANLGAPRLSRRHRLLAWRETPHDGEVLYYYGFTLLETRGPYETWRFLKDRPFPTQAGPDLRSSWLALYGETLTLLRDFDTAEGWLKKAEEASPTSPWVQVGWSSFFESQDRYDDALAAADRALKLRDWYRPGVQAKSHLLTLLGRDDEACEFLKAASNRLESAAVYLSLAGIMLERGAYNELSVIVQRIDELMPLIEPGFAKGLAGLRSLIAYRLGDIDKAIEYARQSGDKFEVKMADRLADPARRGRKSVHLPVGFVRQHDKTCVPATLSTISRFWSMPTEHLQIAESICYDGTSAFNERHWADTHGWVTREFTVTEESSKTLIDAGIPFTLTTTSPGNAHLQAVIGYDGQRGTLIIRDPYLRNWSEAFADGFLESQQAFGPRGMALVPEAERSRLESLELPDAGLWDLLHEMDGALESHQRDKAEVAFEQLTTQAPNHRITLEAERRLMLYDANPTRILSALEKLLALYPDDALLQLSRLSRLRELGKRDERIETLQRLSDRKDAHPAFLNQLAQELSADAREHSRALDLLKRAIRRNPMDASNYYVRAGILSDQLKFDESLELYRFAACLDDKNEAAAEAYFRMAQYRKQTDVALEWLRNRVKRSGRISSQPVRTLDWALRRLSRDAEGIEALEQAIELRPDDGELLLYAADIETYATFSHFERARELHRRAEGRCPRTEWLRTGARLASYQSQHREALALWREVVELQPMAVDAHRAIASILSEIEGQAAALAHVRAAAERFPHHQPLLALWIEWLHEEPIEVSEPVIRRLIDLNPADAWAHRELGFLLLKQRRFDEAAQSAETAGHLDPTHTAWFHLRGGLFAEQGRMSEARSEYRRALELSIDNRFAMNQLMSCCETTAERLEGLAFLLQELKTQVIYGDGLLNYRSLACQLMDPQELLHQLQDALDARPDLWHAWSACIRQLTDMDKLDEGFELACKATDRFPLMPRIWMDRASVCQVRLDSDGELFALEKAYEINPSWIDITRQLSDLYLRKSDFAKATELLKHAITLSPLDGMSYGWLADIQWRQGHQADAFQNIERAVELAPGYTWAWDCLRHWSLEADQPERPLRVARELTDRRPGEARSWLLVARMMADDPDTLEERLTALQNAIALEPRCVAAFDQTARALQNAGRTEEALAACSPPVFEGHRPVDLLATAAWIRWERGDRDQAIEELRQAVEQDPSFYAGWSQLADWLEEREDSEGYLEASKMLVRLNPYMEGSLGRLAQALLKTGKHEEGKEEFRRAFELFPSYQYAGLSLFDLQIEDDELQDAAKTLSVLEAHASGPFITSKRAVLAARKGDRQTAATAFRELCLDDDDNPWPLQVAYDAMANAQWLSDVRKIISEVIKSETIHPQVGTKWVQAYTQDDRWELSAQLKELMERHPQVGGSAVYELVNVFLNNGKSTQFKEFVRKNEKWLQQSSYTWGSVGWGYTRLHDFQRAYRWMKNWRDQKDAASWMLVNAVEAFRDRNEKREAAEISRHALTLSADGGSQLHRLWLASDEVAAGEVGQARKHLSEINKDELDVDYEFLFTIVEALLDLEEAPEEQRSSVFRSVRQRINQAAKYPNMRAEKARRLFYRSGLRRLAKLRGGMAAALWSWYRLALTY